MVMVLTISLVALSYPIPAPGTTSTARPRTIPGSFPQTENGESLSETGLEKWSESSDLRQNAPEKPNFSGRWRLNRFASDDVAKIVGESLNRNAMVETPLTLRIRQVFGKRHQDPHKQLGRLLVQVLDVPESLLILHEGSTLTLVGPEGRVRTFSIDQDSNPRPVQGVVTTTQWLGMQLVTEVHLQDQGVARMTFALAPGGFQLQWTLQIEHVGLGSAIIVHNVYDFVAES